MSRKVRQDNKLNKGNSSISNSLSSFENLPIEINSRIADFLDAQSLHRLDVINTTANYLFDIEQHKKHFTFQKITDKLDKLIRLVKKENLGDGKETQYIHLNNIKEYMEIENVKLKHFSKKMFDLFDILFPVPGTKQRLENPKKLEEHLRHNIHCCNTIKKYLNLKVQEEFQINQDFLTKMKAPWILTCFSLVFTPTFTALTVSILALSVFAPIVTAIIITCVLIAVGLVTIIAAFAAKYMINSKNQHDIKTDYRVLRNGIDRVQHIMENTLDAHQKSTKNSAELKETQENRNEIIRLLKKIFPKTNSTGIKKILLEIEKSKADISASRLFRLIYKTCTDRLKQSPNNKGKFFFSTGRSDAAQEFYNAGKKLNDANKEVPEQSIQKEFINKLKKIAQKPNAPDNKGYEDEAHNNDNLAGSPPLNFLLPENTK